MLHIESDRCYYVYPSWAELSYTWGDLAHVLSDPLNSPYIRDDPNRRRLDWQALGYPIPVQPFDLIDGPVGGGIIRAHISRREKWLPGLILSTEANIESASGMGQLWDTFDPQAYYLEPMDPPGWQLGVARKKKLYLCGASTEHVESDPGAVYWIVGFRKGRKEIKGLEDLVTWAAHFHIAATRLPGIPKALSAEVAPWFVDPAYEYVWFSVSGAGHGLGYHFAVVIYLSLHLRKVAGPRLLWMHLVSDIEGKPNARRNWHKK